MNDHNPIRHALRRIVLLLVLAAAPGGAMAYDSFEVGAWHGESIYGADGVFEGCSLRRAYTNAALILVFGAAGGVLISVEADSLQGLEGTDETAVLGIDTAWQADMAGAVADAAIYVPIADSTAFVDAFQSGSKLAIAMAGRRFGFRLDDSSAALDRARTCVTEELALAAPEAPATTGSTVPEGDVWNAIALSGSQGSLGLSWDYASQAEAVAAALAQCGEGGATDCTIVIGFRNGCGAFSAAPNGPWAAEAAGTKEEAESRALDGCAGRGGEGCKVIDSFCSK